MVRVGMVASQPCKHVPQVHDQYSRHFLSVGSPVATHRLSAMCTMDYVSHVLGLQGWERAWDEDAYFAGEEEISCSKGKTECYHRFGFVV